jgi:cytochrome P450
MNKFPQATQLLKPGPTTIVKVMVALAYAPLAKWMKWSFQDKESTLFFVNIIKSAMKQRKETGMRRNDLIDIVLDALKSRGSELHLVELEGQHERDALVKPSSGVAISEEELEDYMVTNSLLLFMAGFENNSTTLALVLWALAKHLDVQERLFLEIQDVIEEKGGIEKLDYNTVMNMEYLDNVINELLRYHPMVMIERVCAKDYKVPDSDFVIPKGMLVQMNSIAFVKDKDIFPNPSEYNPDNFNAEAKANRSPYAFQTFGLGPRNCIGMRFALVQIKIALLHVLSEYRLVPSSKTAPNLSNPDMMTGMPKSGIWATFEKRA